MIASELFPEDKLKSSDPFTCESVHMQLLGLFGPTLELQFNVKAARGARDCSPDFCNPVRVVAGAWQGLFVPTLELQFKDS